MKKIYLFICVGIFTLIGKAQQDPQYNLYQFNPLIINPAYAGAKDGFSAVVSNRQQWVGFDGAPKTTCLSVHAPVLNKNLGLGLTVTNDALGARNVTSFYANVAYILKINRKLKLSFGLNAGYERYQFNFNKISFESQEVPTQFQSSQTNGALDINAGIFLRNQKFFIGLSSTHINSAGIYDYAPTTATTGTSADFTYHLSTHLFLTAGYSFKLNEDVIFAPTILVKKVAGVQGADLNLNFFMFKKLWLGAFIRTGFVPGNSVSIGPGALIQYYVTKNFKVAYSFDTGLSDARRLGGSHEIMLGVDFGSTKNRMMNPRFL